MPPGGKHAVHDRLLSALERLEAKPTQAAAWEELQRLCHDLRPDNLPGLLHAAGSPSPSSTQFSRVHCARLAALCVTPGACPPATWHALLQPPLLPKLLALLARSLRDADAAVRAAAAEGLGVVAEQLAPAPGAPPTGGWGTACEQGAASLVLKTCRLSSQPAFLQRCCLLLPLPPSQQAWWVLTTRSWAASWRCWRSRARAPRCAPGGCTCDFDWLGGQEAGLGRVPSENFQAGVCHAGDRRFVGLCVFAHRLAGLAGPCSRCGPPRCRQP